MASAALQISAQRCLEPPYPVRSDLDSFASLLIAACSNFSKHESLDALLSSLVQLGSFLRSASLSSHTRVKEQAQQAVAAVVTLLKEQDTEESDGSDRSIPSDVPERAAALAHVLDDLGNFLNRPASHR